MGADTLNQDVFASISRCYVPVGAYSKIHKAEQAMLTVEFHG